MTHPAAARIPGLYEDQAIALPRILAQGAARAVVMFTSGPEAGEAIGQWQGEPLYHASLSPGAYGEILSAAGFVPASHLASENAGLNRLVWLARRGMTAR